METNKNHTPTTSISSDWDQPLTDLDLQVIDAAFLSATSSRPTPGDCPEGDLPNIRRRRRLPASLFTHRRQRSKLVDDKLSSECNDIMSVSSSPSMLPCPRNSSFNIYRSPCQDNLKIVTYPAMSFKGRIVYSRTMSEVEKAADELLQYVEMKKRDAERAIIGFDIEWRPTFTKGVPPGKAAVMQICVDITLCHVMHIIHSGLPQSLQALLRDPTFVKVGVGIANDARKVFKDHNVSVEALEDLSCLANRKLGGDPKVWSLTSLTERLVCRQLPKPSRIRLGNWEAAPLSKAQLDYAATDAYASWYMYEVLNRFPDAVGDETDEVEKNEEATPVWETCCRFALDGSPLSL